jgi:hypothetical protein
VKHAAYVAVIDGSERSIKPIPKVFANQNTKRLFNAVTNYNLLFRSETGTDSESQITARRDLADTVFEDKGSGHWSLAAEAIYIELLNGPDQAGRMVESFRPLLGTNQMLAYFVMTAVRLKEHPRVPFADRQPLSPLRPDRFAIFEA